MNAKEFLGMGYKERLRLFRDEWPDPGAILALKARALLDAMWAADVHHLIADPEANMIVRDSLKALSDAVGWEPSK